MIDPRSLGIDEINPCDDPNHKEEHPYVHKSFECSSNFLHDLLSP